MKNCILQVAIANMDEWDQSIRKPRKTRQQVPRFGRKLANGSIMGIILAIQQIRRASITIFEEVHLVFDAVNMWCAELPHTIIPPPRS